MEMCGKAEKETPFAHCIFNSAHQKSLYSSFTYFNLIPFPPKYERTSLSLFPTYSHKNYTGFPTQIVRLRPGSMNMFWLTFSYFASFRLFRIYSGNRIFPDAFLSQNPFSLAVCLICFTSISQIKTAS